jgi:hypothetical protein
MANQACPFTIIRRINSIPSGLTLAVLEPALQKRGGQNLALRFCEVIG